MSLNNKVYDVLKWTALVAIPAFSVLYFTLAGIWGLAYAEEVVMTASAVELCIGTLLGITTPGWNKQRIDGTVNVVEDETSMKYDLALEKNPEEVLESKDEIVFKVNRETQ